MKLNKEQKQKLMLGGMLVVGVIYVYFQFLLSPMQRAKAAARAKTVALEPKIAKDRAQLAKVAQLKSQEPEAREFMAQVDSMIPGGSPIAWFPPRMSEFFKKHGVERVTARLNSEIPDREITGFRLLTWGVESQKVDFINFATALSALENEEPLVEVRSFEVEAGREDVGVQRASISLHNLIRL